MTTKKTKNSTDKAELIVSKKMESQLPIIKDYSHDELVQMSNIWYKSKMLPSHLQSPEATYIAMRWAIALRLDPFLGLRDIFVVDNIPSIRTEAAIALVEASGFCEYIKQEFIGNPFDDSYTAICKVKRNGRDEHVSTFSVSDAKRAGLWGKKTKSGQPTSWISYPKRMLNYRAVGFALRDVFPDVLRGAVLKEEIIDYAQYEIVQDKSTSNSIDAVIVKTNKGSGLSRMNNIMDAPPPDDED